jgi:hypothetical protein
VADLAAKLASLSPADRVRLADLLLNQTETGTKKQPSLP